MKHLHILIKIIKRNLIQSKKKCYFIGYGIDGLGYRLWDIDNKKIIRSRDFIFNTKIMYKDRL